MKKILSVLLMLCMLLSLGACGGASKSGAEVGKYTLTEMSENGVSMTDQLKEMGMSDVLDASYLELKEDGTGSMNLAGDESKFTWKDGKLTMDGVDTKYEYKDNKITLKEDDIVIVFERSK